MSEKRITDEQVDEFLSEVKGGLSISDEDIAAASHAASSTRDDDGGGRSAGAGRSRGASTAPWLIPFAAIVAVALIGSAWLHFSRSGRLDAMERELAALREQSSTGNNADVLRLELDQLQARVEGLTTRLDVIRDNGADIKALQEAVVEQQATLDVLSEGMGEAEAAGADEAEAAGADEAEAADADGSGAEPGQTAAPADDSDAAPDADPGVQDTQAAAAPSTSASESAGGASWTINLITVGDPESVERIDTQLDELGIELRVDRVEIDDRSLKRLAVPGFGSYDEAQTTAARLKEQLGLPEDPWISRE